MTEMDFDIAYLQAAIGAGRGETRIFGLRLMREYLEALSAVLDRIYPGYSSDFERLKCAFGNVLYFHLTRESKLAQAVSLVKAQQSGLWHIAPDGTEIERRAASRERGYDFNLIRQELSALEAYDAAWNEWFAQQQVTPFRVEYEILSEFPVRTLIQICEALGVEVPKAESITPGVAKLADEVSLDWMRRFHADLNSASQSLGKPLCCG
jgi:LPS sulfotransferase NodH